MIKKSLEELGKSDFEEMKERSSTRDIMSIKLNRMGTKPIESYHIGILLLKSLSYLYLYYFLMKIEGIHPLYAYIGIFVFFLIDLIFCEKIFQFFSEKNPQRTLLKLIGLAYFFLFILSPLYWLTNALTKRFKPKNNSNALSEEDISDVIEIAEGGVDVQQETDMLKGIVRFSDLSVSDIMISRIDIKAIPTYFSIQEIIKVAEESGFSRIPVYENNIDNIKGVLYVKDLLPHIGKEEQEAWHEWIRPCYYVHEHKSVSELLRNFQEGKIHLSIVVDEYGGTSGLVTLEDVIEEIVGDISDEFDKTHLSYEKIDDNTYLFEGKTSLLDFCKIMGMTDDSIFEEIKGDSETLAGMLIEVEGNIPEEGEEIHIKHFLFKIEKSDNRRIEKIKIQIRNETDS